MKTLLFVALVFLVVIIAGCAPTPVQIVTIEDPAGFWAGLWDGFIAPISFIFSLFNDNVAVYDCNNKGGLYDLAFLFGLLGLWGGGSHV